MQQSCEDNIDSTRGIPGEALEQLRAAVSGAPANIDPADVIAAAKRMGFDQARLSRPHHAPRFRHVERAADRLLGARGLPPGTR